MFRCMEKAWYRYACNAPDKKDEAANAAGLFPFPSVGWARWVGLVPFQRREFLPHPVDSGMRNFF